MDSPGHPEDREGKKMLKFHVVSALENLRDAKAEWAKAVTKFNADVEFMMRRLLHEAAHNYMSAEEVARASGMTTKRIRDLMRKNGLNPRDGKTLLAKHAAEALHENSALLGIEPHEMDLMSPLAYLPMGKALREELQNQTISQVHEIEEVDDRTDLGPIAHAHRDGVCVKNRAGYSCTKPLVHGINYWDDEVACGHLNRDPILVTHDLDRLTCPGCRVVLIKGEK